MKRGKGFYITLITEQGLGGWLGSFKWRQLCSRKAEGSICFRTSRKVNVVGCNKHEGKLRFKVEAGGMLFGAVEAHVRILYFILNVMDIERTLKAFEQGR